MTTETKILGVILIITVALLGGGVFFLSRGSSESSKAVQGTAIVSIDYSKGQKIGSDSAKVRLVEFSDFQCPACLAAEPVIRKIRSTYPDQVQLIYRHFPLPQHAHGREAASFAEAAGEQGRFWEMHNKLFDAQAEWSSLPEVNLFFMDLGKQVGLDEGKLKQAAAENGVKQRIEDDIAEGQRLGVNSTPTFFINGHRLNLQSFEDLNTAVAEELKK